MSTAAPSLRARLRYKFDTTLAAGTASVILYLALMTLLLIVIAGLVLSVADVATSDGSSKSFGESVWQSLLRSMDPGTMGGDEGWPYRIISLLVTVSGIFVVSALIGLISAGIDQKLEELRKGRSPVLEKGHTLVLGWSPKLFSIISELVVANENQRDSCVVVMAPEDKVAMEDELRSRVPEPGKTRIVCRTGDPSDPSDLALVQPYEAKAVIILCPDGEEGDAHVTRSVLALMKDDRNLTRMPVIAELNDSRHAAALRRATGGTVHTIVSTDVIARITAQVCRQAGLSAVYLELLDFDGDEIYFHHEPSLAGRPFAEALLAYDKSALIGIRYADGRIELNPPGDTVLGPDDRLIGISEDDDTFTLVGGTIDTSAPPLPPGADDDRPEHILVLGWNDLGPIVLRELDEHVSSGSSARIMTDPTHLAEADVEPGTGLLNIEVSTEEAETASHEPIAAALADREYDHVIILCYREDLTPAESDARTLMTLLQLRQAIDELPADRKHPSVATELLDVRDVELARITSPDDFVVSERLTSLMMAQLSENPELSVVFSDLFDAAGTDLSLKPISRYAPIGQPVAYATLVRGALARGEVAVGYRSQAAKAAGHPAGGVVVNPPKSEQVVFGDDDRLVVLTVA